MRFAHAGSDTAGQDDDVLEMKKPANKGKLLAVLANYHAETSIGKRLKRGVIVRDIDNKNMPTPKSEQGRADNCL